MEKYEIVISVIASRSRLYDEMVKIYWIPFINHVNKNHKNIKIFLIYNSPICDFLQPIKDNILIFNFVENLIPGVLQKTIKSFEFIESNIKYNKILRTNLSSFLIIDNLIKLYNTLPDDNLYAGVIGNHSGKKFVGGAGIWLSRDVLKYIIEHKDNLKYRIIDDVSLSLLVSKMETTNRKYFFKNLNRFDLVHGRYIPKKIIDIKNMGHYHIRIKNEKNRKIDLKYMQEFVKELYI